MPPAGATVVVPDRRHPRQNGTVAESLLDQIEQDVLDENVSVATALRKCVALGGRSGSETLRDWATRELEGYYGSDDLPKYRIIAAPIRLDGIAGNYQITGQAVPPSTLPDVARDHVKEQVELREGVGHIEELAKMPEIKIGLPGGGDLTRLMNAESSNPFQRIDTLYWAVSPAAVKGALDQIRTALMKLVAELRAATPAGQEVPSEAAANQAMNFVISGKRAKVNVTASQASGSGSNATSGTSASSSEPGFWTTSRRIGATVGGIATVAGAVFAGIEVF